MEEENKKISDEALEYVKRHKKEIVAKFASPALFPPDEYPVSIFMAGSPGAGKTEYSRELVGIFFGDSAGREVVRIDADEIREILPGYSGGNAHLFQPAVSVAVEKIHDGVLANKQNFILDTTLAFAPEKAQNNVLRSLEKGRVVFIFYIYQDPIIAWDFTQKREVKEGRRISRDVFIEQFFQARENVNMLKEHFGDSVKVYVVEKDFKNRVGRVWAGVDKIDNYIELSYTKEELKNKL